MLLEDEWKTNKVHKPGSNTLPVLSGRECRSYKLSQTQSSSFQLHKENPRAYISRCKLYKYIIEWSNQQCSFRISSLANSTFGHGCFNPKFWRARSHFTGSALCKEISIGSCVAWRLCWVCCRVQLQPLVGFFKCSTSRNIVLEHLLDQNFDIIGINALCRHAYWFRHVLCAGSRPSLSMCINV